MARPKAALVVTKVDRQVLDSMAHRARTAPHLARRARIVLACATGRDNTTVAKKLRMSKPTVGRWRQRFIDKGGDGLLDEPRPGAPRTINDTQVEAVVTRTLETTPRGATHWSTRTLAKATGVSPMRVHRIWQAFGLQPHRTKSFKLSPDPLLIDKVRDIVGLYLNPPQHAAVFCVDEQPQIQALDRTAPLLPLRPGQAERRTHDYKRHGTTSLFAALEVKTGHVLGQIRRRHRAIEFRAFLTALDVQVPADLDVHVIMDNDGTHKTALIRRWFARHPRFHPVRLEFPILSALHRGYAGVSLAVAAPSATGPARRGPLSRARPHGSVSRQVKQGEPEVLHARDRVGQTSGATQRDLKPGCRERIGNSRRTGSLTVSFESCTSASILLG